MAGSPSPTAQNSGFWAFASSCRARARGLVAPARFVTWWPGCRVDGSFRSQVRSPDGRAVPVTMLAAGAGPRARRSLVPGSQPAADGQLDPCQRPWAREPSLTPGSSPPSFSPGRTGAAADKLNSICVRLIVGPGSLPEELHPGTHSRSLRGSSRSGGGKRAAARPFCLSCEPSPVQKSLSFPARLRELAQSFKAALRPVMWCCWLCRVSELILPQNFGLSAR
jgi:hypothetical protein